MYFKTKFGRYFKAPFGGKKGRWNTTVFFLSFYVSIYLYLFIYLCGYLTIYLSIYLYIYLSIYLEPDSLSNINSTSASVKRCDSIGYIWLGTRTKMSKQQCTRTKMSGHMGAWSSAFMKSRNYSDVHVQVFELSLHTANNVQVQTCGERIIIGPMKRL